MKFNKQKIFEIILTALLSALIAFLQTVISQLTAEPTLQNDPALAGAVAVVFQGLRSVKFS